VNYETYFFLAHRFCTGCRRYTFRMFWRLAGNITVTRFIALAVIVISG